MIRWRNERLHAVLPLAFPSSGKSASLSSVLGATSFSTALYRLVGHDKTLMQDGIGGGNGFCRILLPTTKGPGLPDFRRA
jgi:hypothetical protein